jgi:tRNA(Ile)-lysidine synthase TilS/MesJ
LIATIHKLKHGKVARPLDDLIETFSQNLELNPISFTAAGFFELNWSNLGKIWKTVLYFELILLQFYFLVEKF